MDIIYPMTNFYRQVFKQANCTHASFLTALILLCLQTNIYAADSVEKIHINADHMHLNMNSGISVYTGNVIFSQGGLVLSGDKVTLKQKNNEIEQITVVGKPARYNHVTEKGENIEAESENMVYNASQNKLVMTINASLQQPDNLLRSQKIIYDTLKKIIIAGGEDKTAPNNTTPESNGDAKEKQRVNITLTPKKQLQPTGEPATE